MWSAKLDKRGNVVIVDPLVDMGLNQPALLVPRSTAYSGRADACR